MSRGGRGGGRGGFGGRGRGGFPGGSSMPPMGLSFADLASLSREPTALYPSIGPVPVLSALTPEDKDDIQHQIAFENSMRASAYYIVEPKKSKNLSQYSDKYRPAASARPTLKRKDLHESFFPPEVFEAYFNPKKKRKLQKKNGKRPSGTNFEDLEREEQERHTDEDGDEDDQKDGEEEDPDYDQDEEEDDNDYVEEYFDNGEGEDEDYLGGPRVGDDDGAADMYY